LFHQIPSHSGSPGSVDVHRPRDGPVSPKSNITQQVMSSAVKFPSDALQTAKL
jgi:hypothetical protein